METSRHPDERVPFDYAKKLVAAGYKQPWSICRTYYMPDGAQVWVGGLRPTEDMLPCPMWGMLKGTKYYDL